jgi:(heptosyl)LPS beta-1,4-glucosyltransferase
LLALLLLLFAPPALAVAVTGAAALALCFYVEPAGYDPGPTEKRLFFAACFFVVIGLIAALVHWHVPFAAAGLAALLLVYPVHRAARGGRLDEPVLWSSIALAAVVAAAVAATRLALAGPSASLDDGTWIVAAFALGAMLLGAVDAVGSRRFGFAFLIAGVLGLMTALATGVWGAWLALPVILATWFLYLPRRLSWRFRASALLVLFIGIELVLAVNGTGALTRFRWLVLQSNVWWYSGGTAGYLGAVLGDWQHALAAFAAHPWIGVPLHGGAGDLNQYVLTLSHFGLVGALALALLIGVPGRAFARMIVNADAAVARIGRAGLLLVTAFGVMGLIEPVFSVSRTLAFYAFSVAALYAVGRRCRRLAGMRPVERTRSLSVTVIARNEADRIGDCLASVAGWADEIIVLDSGSMDDTATIARRYTEHVRITDWPGFGVQKQRALEAATCDWVLSLDADEAATQALRHEIDVTLQAEPRYAGFRVPWAVMVGGKRLDFCRSKAPVRLTRRRGARFATHIVHERIVPPGRIGRLESRLLHYTWRDYGHALEKSACYAWLGAERRHARGRWGGGLPIAALRSLWVFFQTYVLRLGLLDGGMGFLIAVVDMQDSFNKYAGLWTLRRDRSNRDNNRA